MCLNASLIIILLHLITDAAVGQLYKKKTIFYTDIIHVHLLILCKHAFVNINMQLS